MRKLKTALFIPILLFNYSFGKKYKKYKTSSEKGRLNRLFDLLYWLYKEGVVNRNYYMHGINQKGYSIKDYIGTKRFLKTQGKANKLLSNRLTQIESFNVLLKDKFIFWAFIHSLGIPAINNLFLIVAGKLQSLTEITEISLLENGMYIIKNASIESGRGVKTFEIKNQTIVFESADLSETTFLRKFKSGVWIIQPRIESHQKIKTVNASALNTTRIYTMNTGSDIVYMGSFQAFATDNAPIDSWQYGSIYVGIDEKTGNLNEHGLTSENDLRLGLLKEHPNSQVRFENYVLPYFNESVLLCKKAHRYLYGFFVIGWDIAITDKGPIIVEANEKPGIHVIQSFSATFKANLFTGFEQLKKWAYESN